MNTLKSRLFRTCPKSGRIVGVRQPEGWARLWFPLIGLAAAIWFALRVLPKPSRAAYPCQRVAMPLASGFVLWLAGIGGASLALGGARRSFRQARWLSGGLAVLVALVGVGWAVLSFQQASLASALPAQVEYTPHPANQPIGVAKGLAPGRVVWAHQPSVTVWNGTTTAAGQRWYDLVSQPKANDLMEWALTGYAGASTTSAAWNTIFQSFNGGPGYQPGEKVFIKVNLTTSYSDGCADANYNWTITCLGGGSPTGWTYIGNSPQMMIALLDQLVNVVGVAQTNITIGDSSGLWVNELYNPVHNAFPNLRFMDARGTLGRTKASRSNVPLYWSTSEANGKSQDYILQPIVDAKYVINLAILKAHERNGITVTAKNHYGSLSGGNGSNERKPPTTGYYNIHLRLPLETDPGAYVNRALMGQYRPLVDLNGHAQMGGKTLLYLVDAIYGGKGWAGVPAKWAMAPFNNNWPGSLFLSMDQVAIDSVGFDFLSQQWPDLALGNEGVQDYLHEMALANNPPSGTFYDPERDGTRLASQGVHEHWNNPTDKQYSRNLGTGNGIELVQVRRAAACGLQSVLFVSETRPATAADQALVDRLTTAGYSVLVRNQSETSALEALGKDLVIISDSVTSTNVNTKFRDVMIPVINWEPSLFDDMMMTGVTSGTHYGDLASQTQLNIVDASHPLAAGLAAGLRTTTASPQLYFWGVPSANASVAATLNGYPTRAAVFGYEAGVNMVGMKAPARRVGFFNGSASVFTADGWALYDAAVQWALQCGSVGSFSLVNADTGAVVQALNNGDTLELTTLPANLAIRANVAPAVIGSVLFTFDGQRAIDNTPAYQFSGVPLEWTPGVGAHTLSAQPFSQADARGVASQALSVNFTVTNTPLAVTLASFTAQQQGDAVQVRWETVSEIDNAGFNLYRSTSSDAPGSRLNETLIPSQNPGSPAGSVYAWEDRGLDPGVAYFYRLEAVDAHGVSAWNGPVSAIFSAPTAVTLRDLHAGAGDASGSPAWLALLAMPAALAAGVLLLVRRRPA
ncbi:MAG: DUF362 domain-containing protein [Anaerolineae bacterium]